MDTFQKDNHAINEPVFIPVAREIRSGVLELIRSHYPGLVKDEVPIEVFEGPNISSTNYRVGKFYLKILLRKPGQEHVFAFPQLALKLKAAGIPVGDFIQNKDGEFISEKDYFAYVQKFIRGQFYSGSLEEFNAMVDVLKQLEGALVGYRLAAVQRTAYVDSWVPLETLPAVSEILRDKKLPSESTDGFDLLVAEHIGAALEIAKRYEEEKQSWNFGELYHLDLHPHNLLFEKGKLKAVLDYEAFQAIPQQMSVGFALFKLGRKSISLKRMSIEQFKQLTERRFHLPELHAYVQIELVRRITIILKRHYLERNNILDSDLVKQIRGLKEIDLMFK